MRVALAERTEVLRVRADARSRLAIGVMPEHEELGGQSVCKGCFVGFAARPSLLQHKLMLCSSPLLRCDEAHNNFSHGDGL